MLSLIDNLFQKEKKSDSGAYRSYLNRDDYYINLIRENSISQLISLFEVQKKAPLNSELNIKFRDLPFNLSTQDVTKKLGKASYNYSNHYRIPSHRILFYRTDLHQFKAIIQLHFIENRLFFAKYNFRSMSSYNQDDILQTLQKKYFNKGHFKLSSTHVRDAFDNVVILDKSLNLNVSYLSGDPFFSHFVSDLRARKDASEKAQEALKFKTLEDNL